MTNVVVITVAVLREDEESAKVLKDAIAVYLKRENIAADVQLSHFLVNENV